MSTAYQQQLPLFETSPSSEAPSVISSDDNSLSPEDRSFHDWYRFVLSFPPHLVRDYLQDFGVQPGDVVLDPFCGTGTTLVEAKLNQIASVGLEANPFPQFASSVKTDWDVGPDELEDVMAEVAEATYDRLREQGIDDKLMRSESGVPLQTLDSSAMKALIGGSISPLPLHKTLVLKEELDRFRSSKVYQYGILALGNALVTRIGNLRFGPEVGVGKKKPDVPVVASWLHDTRRMIKDLEMVEGQAYPRARVCLADARHLRDVLEPSSIDAVITSPPYPNEKDYTRTTRLESVILGFFQDMTDLRGYKKTLLRSNTRGVYKPDDDDQWVASNERIQELAERIEARRIRLGKTSGFERLYARVTKLYFGGMARHLAELTEVLRPGAQLAYVVGDQASYLRVMIRTGELLAEIARDVGYEVTRIDLFRTRFATATQEELREEVVVLRWPGRK